MFKCYCGRLPDPITEQRRYEAQRDLRPLTRPAELPPNPQTECSPAPGYREEEPRPCSPRHRSAAHPSLSLSLSTAAAAADWLHLNTGKCDATKFNTYLNYIKTLGVFFM